MPHYERHFWPHPHPKPISPQKVRASLSGPCYCLCEGLIRIALTNSRLVSCWGCNTCVNWRSGAQLLTTRQKAYLQTVRVPVVYLSISWGQTANSVVDDRKTKRALCTESVLRVLYLVGCHCGLRHYDNSGSGQSIDARFNFIGQRYTIFLADKHSKIGVPSQLALRYDPGDRQDQSGSEVYEAFQKYRPHKRR